MTFHVPDWGTLVLAAIAVLGVFSAILRWFFKRGADEREFSVALRDATEAIKELSAEFRKFRDEVIEQVHGLDLRVTRLEVAPPPIHVTTKVEAPPNDGTPAVRDAGSPGGYPER